VIDLIVMDERSAAATPCVESVGGHPEHGIEVLP
jgi:hypothetical protein